MEYKGNYWLTNSQMARYQTMLCEKPHVWLEVVKTLNPAALLPVDSAPPEHDCLEIMDEVLSGWPVLTDQPISYPDIDNRDDSSFVWDNTRFARYTIVTLDTVTEAQPLPVGTSAQKSELIALVDAPAHCRSASIYIYLYRL
jgi:hypothetical protein